MNSTVSRSFLALSLGATVAACGGNQPVPAPEDTSQTESTSDGLSGDVLADGSSTVGPVTIAAAESFQAVESGVNVSVGTSGSGGGFTKFCTGETDISNASRPIKETEIETCDSNGIEFVEIPVAFDGLAVVTSKDNEFTQCLTTEQLNFNLECGC